MQQAQNGDTVQVHYTGTLEDGTVFDTSADGEPLEFTLGEGRLIPGFESGVVGMAIDESKTITIPAEQAYGPYRPELVVQLARSEFPEEMELQPGQHLQMGREGHPPMILRVAEATDAEVTLDANHPLAGKELTFEVRLVAIA